MFRYLGGELVCIRYIALRTIFIRVVGEDLLDLKDLWSRTFGTVDLLLRIHRDVSDIG